MKWTSYYQADLRDARGDKIPGLALPKQIWVKGTKNVSPANQVAIMSLWE